MKNYNFKYSLGRIAAYYRHTLGMTQKQMAERAHYSESAISAFECNATRSAGILLTYLSLGMVDDTLFRQYLKGELDYNGE